MLVFGLRLTTFVTEVLARRFELRWFDDVCNVGCPLVARPGLAAAHGCRSQAQVLWLANGSARQTARSSETAIAFACACMRGIETAITFAGEKRAILVQFPGAKVSLVSMVAVRGEHWCCGFQSPASECTVRDFFALLGQECARARKSSPSMLQRAKNRCFMACWANFFAEMPLEGACWASFFAEMPLEGACWASFFAEMPMVGVCWSATAGRDPVGSRPASRAPASRAVVATAQVETEPRSLLRRIRGSGVAHALSNRVGDRRGDNLGTHESRE